MRTRIALAAAIAALGVTGVAQAADWPVAVGEQAPPPASAPKGATLNGFFPAKVVINAGDTVTFTSAGFHTVMYTGGKAAPGLLMPDPTKAKYDAMDDAAGQPFYFGGLPKLIYNPAAFGPAGGKTITKGVPASTGVLAPAGPKSPPAKATYTFPQAGTFRLICTIHPGMKVDVVVRASGASVPFTPTQVKSQALAQIANAWTQTVALAGQAVPANTVYAGIGGSPSILGFFPRTLTVKVGTTVKFVNKSPSEPHNAAFGPQKYVLAFSKKTDLFPTGPGSKNQVTPAFPYGTEPKGSYSYDGSNHGNGFLVTPLTAGSPAVPLPRSGAVTFTKAGTYKYFCLLHGPDMSGTIKVTP